MVLIGLDIYAYFRIHHITIRSLLLSHLPFVKTFVSSSGAATNVANPPPPPPLSDNDSLEEKFAGEETKSQRRSFALKSMECGSVRCRSESRGRINSVNTFAKVIKIALRDRNMEEYRDWKKSRIVKTSHGHIYSYGL